MGRAWKYTLNRRFRKKHKRHTNKDLLALCGTHCIRSSHFRIRHSSSDKHKHPLLECFTPCRTRRSCLVPAWLKITIVSKYVVLRQSNVLFGFAETWGPERWLLVLEKLGSYRAVLRRVEHPEHRGTHSDRAYLQSDPIDIKDHANINSDQETEYTRLASRTVCNTGWYLDWSYS